MGGHLKPGIIPTTVLHNLADGACRTIDQLDEQLEFNRRQISDGAAKLVYRGFLERVEAGCYQLTKAGLEAAADGKKIKSGPWKPLTGKSRKPRANTFRQRAWNAMRMSVEFTFSDIVIAADRNDKGPKNNLQAYMRQLVRAKYVAELPTRVGGTSLTSNGFKRFMLLTNSGPVAPTVRRVKTSPDAEKSLWEVFDGNTQEVTPCQIG